jgi:hypothetical protein
MVIVMPEMLLRIRLEHAALSVTDDSRRRFSDT